jgi:exosortase A
VIPPSTAVPPPGTGASRGWKPATAAFAFAVLAALVAYRDTVASFVQVWQNSATFAHGFLIVPISAGLVWLRRRTLQPLAPRPYPIALLMLPLLGLTWFVGHATDTFLVEQLSLVAMIPALAVVCFGPRAARSQAFALGFLFFTVPFGPHFQPFLMKVTADFVVRALKISGIPVVREGLFFAIPGAKWRIVEACSGLHFLVSGLALACLYGFWVYRKVWKRVLFAACTIAALILANGIRAYLIVLVGYLSHMRLGMGYEHNAIGWLVFMVVMAILFGAGLVLRDRTAPTGAPPDLGASGHAVPPFARPTGWIGVAGVAAVALGVWPTLLANLPEPGPGRPTTPISAPEPRGGWFYEPDTLPVPRPVFVGATSETTRAYAKDGAMVQCYLAFYEHQHQGRELIQFENVVVPRNDARWWELGDRNRHVRWDGGRLAVRETDVRDRSVHVVVWHWFWYPDEFTASPERAKVLQARASLLRRGDHAAVVVLYAPEGVDRDASADLRQFLQEMLPSIRSSLRKADEGR